MQMKCTKCSKNVTLKYVHSIEADRTNPTKAFLSFKCHKIWNEIECVHKKCKQNVNFSLPLQLGLKCRKDNMFAIDLGCVFIKSKEHSADRQRYLFALEKSLYHKRCFKRYCERYTLYRIATRYRCFEFISHFPVSLLSYVLIK